MGELADRLSAIQSSKNLSDDVREERMRGVRQEMTKLARQYVEQHRRAAP
jgi:hypothetical protein